MSGNETLLGASAIHLFGRPLTDLILRSDIDDPLGLPRGGHNNFLEQQLADASLARIYAFAYEGGLFELARPAIFLVHGPGRDPDDPAPTNIDGNVEFRRLYRSPGSSAQTGLGIQVGAFAQGMRVWRYDKGDFSMRLEVETGTLEQILLAAEAAGEASGIMARSGGATARSGGVLARSGGVMARSGGWSARRVGDLD